MSMPVSRRLALLEWARASQAWIVEDDYDSEFNYQSAPWRPSSPWTSMTG